MAIEYTKFAFLILGLLFSPLQEVEQSEAYFCAININIDDFEIEPVMFESKDKGKRFVFFNVGLAGAREEYFIIEREQAQSLKFKIYNTAGDDFFEIELGEYFQGIDDHTFSWDSEAMKSLQFKNGNAISVYKVGETVYLKTDEFKEILFVIHK
ncbi:MAG: hypothetical protein JW822_06860 [Spirochaetales bacterium]|nr:hypothetical protein [Spirochaetales bacterium]